MTKRILPPVLLFLVLSAATLVAAPRQLTPDDLETISFEEIDTLTLFNGDDGFFLDVPSDAVRLVINLTSSPSESEIDLFVRFDTEPVRGPSHSVIADYSSTNLGATAHLGLGSSYYLLGDFENAAAAWRKSLELEPSTSAYMNVGSSYFFLGRFDEAAVMYNQASELAPDDFEVWGSLGDAYHYTENNKALAKQAYQTAIELGEKLLDINRSDALTMAPLAQYHAHIGNAARATELISHAEQLEPQNMYVHYFSAVTNVILGNDDTALAAIEKAVALGYPTNLLQLDAGLATLSDNRMDALLRNSSP